MQWIKKFHYLAVQYYQVSIKIQKAFHPIVFCCSIVVKFGLMHLYVGWRFGPIKNQNIMRQANAGIMQMLLGHKSCKPAVIEITVQGRWNSGSTLRFCQVKFIYSDKATKLCEIFPLLLSVCTVVKIKGEYLEKFCGFLRIYELYLHIYLFILLQNLALWTSTVEKTRVI